MRESTRRRRRERAAGFALSLLAHALVLAALGLAVAPELRLPPLSPPAMQVRFVDLAPTAPGAPQPRLSRSGGGAAASVPAAASPAAPARPRPVEPLAPSAEPTPQPSAGPPRPNPSASAGASGAGIGVHPGPLPGAEAGGDLKGLLRATVGCDHREALGLTAAERDRCNQHAGEMARNAPEVDRIPPEKRAYYDQVSAAYAKMRAPAPSIQLHNGDNLGIQERWAGEPGAHLPGFGCGLPLGRPKGWKSYHDKPPHSLKLGLLPCFVTPPSGFGTEEADVQDPASLRERQDDAKHMRDLDPPATGR